MDFPPDPRLTQIVRELEDIAGRLDDLRAEVVELLREQGLTWEAIGEMHNPPKSRQALSRWMSTRRRRRSR